MAKFIALDSHAVDTPGSLLLQGHTEWPAGKSPLETAEAVRADLVASGAEGCTVIVQYWDEPSRTLVLRAIHTAADFRMAGFVRD